MNKNKDYRSTVKFGVKEKGIIVGLVMSIVILFVISAASYYKTYNAVKYRAKSSLTDQTEKCASDVERIFELKFTMLKYLVKLPEINGMDMQTQKDYLADKVKDLGFESMFVMYADGKGYYINEDKVRDQKDEPFFKSVMENDSFITAPFYQTEQKRSITTLCQSIIVDGKKVGSLCGVISLSDLDEIVQSVRADMEASIVNSEGSFVVNKDMKLVDQQKNISFVFKKEKEMLNVYKKGIKSGKLLKQEANYEETKYYATTAPIGYTDWTICMSMKRDDAVQGLDTLIVIQFISIAVLLGVFITISIAVARMIKRDRETFLDELTGISNRARTIVELGSADLNKEQDVMVVDFDLNDVNVINSQLGHKSGDNAIKDFSKALTSTFGAVGFVGRMGGDEFVAILTGNVEVQFDKAIKNMFSSIAQLNGRNDVRYSLAPAYGYAIRRASDKKKSLNDVYKEADQKRYIYKDNYKNAGK